MPARGQSSAVLQPSPHRVTAGPCKQWRAQLSQALATERRHCCLMLRTRYDARRMTQTAVAGIDSPAAWWRLLATLAMSTLGGVGMWSVIVVLPAVQAEFGVDRATATLPYTLTMIGYGFGGILMGRLSDRYGVARPLAGATIALATGYFLSALAPSLTMFALAHALLIGFLGSSASFGPLLADISHWFERRRGLAVAIVACGNYLAGTLWPPVVQHLIEILGWRDTQIAIGAICLVTMLPLSLALRRRPPQPAVAATPPRPQRSRQPTLGISPAALQVLLVVAGLCLLCSDVDAAGPHRRLLRRPRLRAGSGRTHAVADAGIRHRQPPAVRLDRRPHRRRAHIVARIGAAGHRAAAVRAFRRAGVALHRVGAVRAVPGRHRPELRADHPRVLSTTGGRRARRHSS